VVSFRYLSFQLNDKGCSRKPESSRMSSTILIYAPCAFVLTVETGSVTEASRRMGRTQSAITQQIQKLEQLIGKPLFDDTRRTSS
jgi:hypothetical protein